MSRQTLAGAGSRTRPARLPSNSSWRLSGQGLRTVAVLELRQRVRSTRWVVVLMVWGAVIGVAALLVRQAAHVTVGGLQTSAAGSSGASAQVAQQVGATTFGLITFLVLALGALVAPALSATSINGDRQAGVLAALQSSLLSPAEIAIGKLVAAWTTALALLAVAAPFLVWAHTDGGTSLTRLLVTLGVLAVSLLVVCAIGLGWSAVTARTSSSAVLTYLTVTLLAVGLPALFFVLLPTVSANQPTRVLQETTTGGCHVVTEIRTQQHPERLWWLLAPSPFVVVADAAPAPAGGDVFGTDPLSLIRTAVRQARLGPASPLVECFGAASAKLDAQRTKDQARLPAAWPLGLGVDVLLAGWFVVVSVRRLRAPRYRLARGTRVA